MATIEEKIIMALAHSSSVKYVAESELRQQKKILIHHIPERKLWLAQREAGTNEQWRTRFKNSLSDGWNDIAVHKEPRWLETHEYEVKPKTVKHYFCLYKTRRWGVTTWHSENLEDLCRKINDCGGTIIGNIEEREVEV